MEYLIAECISILFFVISIFFHRFTGSPQLYKQTLINFCLSYYEPDQILPVILTTSTSAPSPPFLPPTQERAICLVYGLAPMVVA